jgi:hypothetical protein
MATTRVLLVDDEALVRRILKQILASYPDMELVGEGQQPATKPWPRSRDFNRTLPLWIFACSHWMELPQLGKSERNIRT